MSLRLMIVAGLFAAATPSLAQTIYDTHTEVWQPGGKTPGKLFRPIARDDCNSGYRHHQTGKMRLTPAVDAERCAAQVAAKAAARNVATGN